MPDVDKIIDELVRTIASSSVPDSQKLVAVTRAKEALKGPAKPPRSLFKGK